jgi:hypothetical protein
MYDVYAMFSDSPRGSVTFEQLSESVKAPLAEVLRQYRETWCEACHAEDDGTVTLSGVETFTVVECETGRTAAVMTHDGEDPTVCHTLFSDGSTASHRCRYILDIDGRYDHTEIVALD